MRKRQFESSLVEIIKECVWKAILKHNNPKLISTDLFFSTEYFLNNISRFGNKTIVELMCHPGHKGDNYDRENSMMEKLIPEYIEQEKFELITWNDL